MNGVARHLPGPLFKVTFRSWLRRGHDRSEQAEAALAAHWPHYADDGVARLVRQAKALDVQDTLAVADRLAHLDVPARVVWGEDDAWRRIEHGERFARDLKAPLRRIAGAKHFTPEDHPDVVAEEINLLLEEVRNARRPLLAAEPDLVPPPSR